MKHQNLASRAVWTGLVLFVAGALVLAGCKNQAEPAPATDELAGTTWEGAAGGVTQTVKFSEDHRVSGGIGNGDWNGTYSIEDTRVTMNFTVEGQNITIIGALNRTANPQTLTLTTPFDPGTKIELTQKS